jgi:hypothetical protein
MYEKRLRSADSLMLCFETIWTCDLSQTLLTNPLLIMMKHVNTRGRVKVCARGILGFDTRRNVAIAVTLTEKVKEANTKQDKQCTYNVTLWCFLVTSVAMETQNFTTCVFLSGLHAVAIAIETKAFLACRAVELAEL